MTIIRVGYMGGESRTLLVDGTRYGAAPAGWSNVTSPVHTGVGAIQIAENGSQATTAGSVVTFTNTVIRCWHAWVVQSGAPSAAGCLAGDTRAGYGNNLALEKNADSQIRLVQMPVSGVWADRTFLTDFSADALAEDNATMKEVALWLDPLTLGTSHVWATLFIDDVQQWSQDIGGGLFAVGGSDMYLCPAVANTGINVVFDDVAGLGSNTLNDAPHLVDWPKPEVYRQLAIGDTAQDDWVNESGDGTYESWDDASGPDDDTTYNRCTTPWAGKYQVSDGQTEGTVGVGSHTVLQAAAIGGLYPGPYINIVYRDEGDDTKWAAAYINSLGIPGEVIPNPGTSYIGHCTLFLRSSGSWTVADFTSLNFGVCVPTGAEHNGTWRDTLCMMIWLLYINSYAHGDFTTPSLPSAGGARSWTTMF